jgi:hypothetical protein
MYPERVCFGTYIATIYSGSASLDLSKLYPELRFVVQDRAETLAGAKDIWNAQNPDALKGRVTFMPHDFFQVNPVKGADIYLLRLVL